MLKNESKNLNKKKIVFYSFDRGRLSVFIVTNLNVFPKSSKENQNQNIRNLVSEMDLHENPWKANGHLKMLVDC